MTDSSATPNATVGVTRKVVRAARWVAPGGSQIISSIGNSLLAFAAARWMGGSDFGLFMLGYSGVLLVSQLFRVAVGEAGLLSASTDAERERAGPRFLGAAVTITPVLGAIAFVIAAGATGDVGFSLATGVGVAVVSTTEVARYSLLSRGLVRQALQLDIVWTIGELMLLVALRATVTGSRAGLLWCWVVSAAVAATPAFFMIGVARPSAALRIFTREGHWWRLTANDALVSATSYVLLAVLSVLAGTAAVGAVRASMLPFQWVQLAIASSWLVVLSRRPSSLHLRRMTRWLFALLVASIAGLAIVIQLIPPTFGRTLLRENWEMTHRLVWYSTAVFAALALSEMAIMRLKAIGATSKVLACRMSGSFATLLSGVLLFLRHTPQITLAVMTVGQLATASFALQQVRSILGPHIATRDHAAGDVA